MLKSKKVISMLLAVVMVLSMSCIGVFAKSNTSKDYTAPNVIEFNSNPVNQSLSAITPFSSLSCITSIPTQYRDLGGATYTSTFSTSNGVFTPHIYNLASDKYFRVNINLAVGSSYVIRIFDNNNTLLLSRSATSTHSWYFQLNSTNAAYVEIATGNGSNISGYIDVY